MTDEKQVITKEKQDAVTLRWLQMATDASKSRGYSRKSDYERPVLSGLHVKNGRTETADGFRVHQAPTPEPLSEFGDGKIVRINEGKGLHKSPGRVYPAEEVEGNFPDIEQVFPRFEPQAVIAVNAKYLREALEMPNDHSSNGVVLKIYGSKVPMLVQDMNDEHRALLMPMAVKNGEFGDEVARQAKEADQNRELRGLAEAILRLERDNDMHPGEKWYRAKEKARKVLEAD